MTEIITSFFFQDGIFRGESLILIGLAGILGLAAFKAIQWVVEICGWVKSKDRNETHVQAKANAPALNTNAFAPTVYLDEGFEVFANHTGKWDKDWTAKYRVDKNDFVRVKSAYGKYFLWADVCKIDRLCQLSHDAKKSTGVRAKCITPFGEMELNLSSGDIYETWKCWSWTLKNEYPHKLNTFCNRPSPIRGTRPGDPFQVVLEFDCKIRIQMQSSPYEICVITKSHQSIYEIDREKYWNAYCNVTKIAQYAIPAEKPIRIQTIRDMVRELLDMPAEYRRDFRFEIQRLGQTVSHWNPSTISIRQIIARLQELPGVGVA